MQTSATARNEGGKEGMMGRRLVSSLVAAGIALGLAAAALPAAADEMHYKIPFSFKVNGATLPPGTYIVSNELNVLVVRGVGLSRGAVAVTNPLASRDDSGALLVFHRYGNVYLLRPAFPSALPPGTRSQFDVNAIFRPLASRAG